MTNPAKEETARSGEPNNNGDVLASLDDEVIPQVLDAALRAAGVDTQDPKVSLAISVLLFSAQLQVMPPDWLTADPQLRERFIQWTADQHQHRHHLEKMKTERSESRLDKAQIFTFIIAFSGLVGATLTAVLAHAQWASAILAVAAIGGPTAATILAGNATWNPFSEFTSKSSPRNKLGRGRTRPE
jgi:hypothetical protein